MSIPEPVYVRDLFGGKATVIAFGAPFNWNYAGTSREEMEAKNPGITAALEEVMRRFNIKRALVPKPSFEANVVTEHDLPNELLPNFCRGADADGVILTRPGDAYFLASADCLTTVLFDPQTDAIAALHCARDSLFDRSRLNGGNWRRHETVIDAARDVLDKTARLPHCVYRPSRAFLAAGIRPTTFHHSIYDKTHGEANKRMIDHLTEIQSEGPHLPTIVIDPELGTIDLFALVRHQLDGHGVFDVVEDEYDTATSMDTDRNYLFHSNRRDKTLRNLIIVRLN